MLSFSSIVHNTKTLDEDLLSRHLKANYPTRPWKNTVLTYIIETVTVGSRLLSNFVILQTYRFALWCPALFFFVLFVAGIPPHISCGRGHTTGNCSFSQAVLSSYTHHLFPLATMRKAFPILVDAALRITAVFVIIIIIGHPPEDNFLGTPVMYTLMVISFALNVITTISLAMYLYTADKTRLGGDHRYPNMVETKYRLSSFGKDPGGWKQCHLAKDWAEKGFFCKDDLLGGPLVCFSCGVELWPEDSSASAATIKQIHDQEIQTRNQDIPNSSSSSGSSDSSDEVKTIVRI